MRIFRRVNPPAMPEPALDAARMARRLTVAGAVAASLIGGAAMGQQQSTRGFFLR